MNGLEEQLSKVLEKALNVAEQTGNFVMTQAPQLLQEFYKWHIAEDIFKISFFLIIFTSFIITYKKAKWNDLETFMEIISIFLGAISLVSFIFFIVACYDLVFITTAPKLYLIEYFIK